MALKTSVPADCGGAHNCNSEVEITLQGKFGDRSSMYATAMTIMLIGLGMVLIGWLFFRKPGVAFWTFAPVWRASKYLKPLGAALWIAGCMVGLIGVALSLLCGHH
jgi:hypothetical protein